MMNEVEWMIVDVFDLYIVDACWSRRTFQLGGCVYHYRGVTSVCYCLAPVKRNIYEAFFVVYVSILYYYCAYYKKLQTATLLFSPLKAIFMR